MPSDTRRAAARRKAWGRGPMILRFEPLETRQLLTAGAAALVAPADARPDLVLTAFGAPSNLDFGDPFHAAGRVENYGNAAAPAGVEVDVYASATPTLGTNAAYVGTVTLAEPIAPGAGVEFREPFEAPPAPLPTLGSAPAYYFVARVDPRNVVPEKNEANNGGGPLDPSSLVTVTPRPLSVLSPGPVSTTTGTLNWGGTLEVAALVANQTGANVPGGRARVVLTPEGRSLVGQEAVSLGELTVPAVGVGQTAQVAGKVRLPDRPPGALAGSTRFTVGVIADVGPVDAYLGAAAVQVAPGAPLPDAAKPNLSVVSLQPLDTELSWSEAFRVKATVQNDGGAESGPLRVSVSVIDANRPGTAPLAVVETVLESLQAGYQQDLLQTVPLGGKLPEGLDLSTVAGRIVVQVDPENAIDESNERDNALTSTPVILKLLTREGRSEVPKPGPVTTAQPPASPSPSTPAPGAPNPAETPNRTPPRIPAEGRTPERRQAPSAEQQAERAAIRRALLTLKTQQSRIGLKVFRDRAHVTPDGPTPRLPMFAPTRPGPRAS